MQDHALFLGGNGHTELVGGNGLGIQKISVIQREDRLAGIPVRCSVKSHIDIVQTVKLVFSMIFAVLEKIGNIALDLVVGALRCEHCRHSFPVLGADLDLHIQRRQSHLNVGFPIHKAELVYRIHPVAEIQLGKL